MIENVSNIIQFIMRFSQAALRNKYGNQWGEFRNT